ncbi:hypothetical protein ACROYT_G021370 [Oculina patagonica]
MMWLLTTVLRLRPPRLLVPSVSTVVAVISRALMEEHVEKTVRRMENDSSVIALQHLLANCVKHTSEEKSEEQRRSEEGLPNFKFKFCDLLEGETFPDVADLEQPEHDSSQELEGFISAEKSVNTVKKTKSEWKRFENYCQEQTDGTFHVETVPADVLDKLLGKFFKDVRKHDGAEYEPDSILSFQRIQRCLKELFFQPDYNVSQPKQF